MSGLPIDEHSWGAGIHPETSAVQAESCRRNVPDHEGVAFEPVLLERKQQKRNASPVERGLSVHDVITFIARHRLRRKLSASSPELPAARREDQTATQPIRSRKADR
ncbi:MAG TPA: hypothetical protein VFB28_04045 [Terriglobales bacterium]|nr:hypothetical protein [Terriglobales bacterium]